jgi:hypothetical protein
VKYSSEEATCHTSTALSVCALICRIVNGISLSAIMRGVDAGRDTENA